MAPVVKWFGLIGIYSFLELLATIGTERTVFKKNEYSKGGRTLKMLDDESNDASGELRYTKEKGGGGSR